MCSVFFTVVLVMLCTKSKQFKMLRRLYYNAGKNTFVFKCNSQLHRQPSIALLLVIKHVPGMFSMKDTIFSISRFNPKSNLWSPVQTMQNNTLTLSRVSHFERSSINNFHSKLCFLYSVQIVQFFFF